MIKFACKYSYASGIASYSYIPPAMHVLVKSSYIYTLRCAPDALPRRFNGADEIFNMIWLAFWRLATVVYWGDTLLIQADSSTHRFINPMQVYKSMVN